MRIVKCDRCGCDISSYENTGYIVAAWRSQENRNDIGPNPYEAHHFCEDCMRDIRKAIDFKIMRAPDDIFVKGSEEPEEAGSGSEDDETDPEESKVVERIRETPAKTEDSEKGWSRERKDIDMGKLGALRRAGWPVSKIADEFGVSDSVIRRRIKEIEE